MSPRRPGELEQLLNDQIKCREAQISQLAILLASPFASPSNLVLHGARSTGKSLTIQTLLQHASLPFVIIRSAECVTSRQLLERALSIAKESFIASGHEVDPLPKIDGRCENISAFVGQLQTLLKGREGKFILVFDGVDRQREAAPTLLPALARMGEIIPSLTTIFIITSPLPPPFSLPGIPHIHFPAYIRAETISLVSSDVLPISSSSSPEDNAWLWTRFVPAAWDSLGQAAARDLPSFSQVCRSLWPDFVKPIQEGLYWPKEFSKLMVRNRALFQFEASLTDSVVPFSSTSSAAGKPTPSSTLTLKLPSLPAHLLLVAYLCSHTPPRLDATLFSKHTLTRKRRRQTTGGPQTPSTSAKKGQAHYTPQKARKISKYQTASQTFPLERLWAVAHAIIPPGVLKHGGMEAMIQWRGLERLGLVASVGIAGTEGLGEGKWRCGVGKGVVMAVARTAGFDLESFLVE